jgi:hypothetical protein
MADPSRDVFCCAVQHVLLWPRMSQAKKVNPCLVSLNLYSAAKRRAPLFPAGLAC